MLYHFSPPPSRGEMRVEPVSTVNVTSGGEKKEFWVFIRAVKIWLTQQ